MHLSLGFLDGKSTLGGIVSYKMDLHQTETSQPIFIFQLHQNVFYLLQLAWIIWKQTARRQASETHSSQVHHSTKQYENTNSRLALTSTQQDLSVFCKCSNNSTLDLKVCQDVHTCLSNQLFKCYKVTDIGGEQLHSSIPLLYF